jgi:hypothetical protein
LYFSHFYTIFNINPFFRYRLIKARIYALAKNLLVNYFLAIILSLTFKYKQDMSVQHLKNQNFTKQPFVFKMIFCTALGFMAGRYAKLFSNNEFIDSKQSSSTSTPFIGWI